MSGETEAIAAAKCFAKSWDETVRQLVRRGIAPRSFLYSTLVGLLEMMEYMCPDCNELECECWKPSETYTQT